MVFYFILFPIPLYKELVIIPVWHIESLEGLSAGSIELKFNKNELLENEQHVFNFRIGRMFGFINLQGDLKLLQQVDYNVALSEKSFINYSNLPNTFVVQDIDGEYVSSFWTSGHPEFSVWVGSPENADFHGEENNERCNLCHGKYLTGGISEVSCYTCHETF